MRRPLRHHPDSVLSVAAQTALVVESGVALSSFSVMTRIAVVTTSRASCAFLSFAPAAIQVLTVVVTWVVVTMSVIRVPSAILVRAAVVGSAVVTRRALMSTAVAAGRATARRAVVHYASLSFALAAEVVGWALVRVHSSARRGGLGVVWSAMVPSPTSTNAAGEDFVFGGGITGPVYQKPFSVESSCRFFKEYREYERNVKLSNSGKTVPRPLLTLSQLLPEHVRWCLADLYFEGKGDEELAESDLQRGLARHGECWTGSDIHPNQAVAEVERLLEMRSEPTAVARIDAARARLEEYFENPGVARIFREKRKYIEGSAHVITQALVRGLKPLEFKKDVEDALKVKGKWKENPNMVFNLIREQALIWRVVERRDEKRRLRGKSGFAGKGDPAPSSPPQQRQRFAIMPGTDDVVVVGSPMLKHLGIDVYEDVEDRTRDSHDVFKAVADRTRDSHVDRITSEDTCHATEIRRVTPCVSGSRENGWQRGGVEWCMIGFIAAMCLGVVLLLTVGVGREMVKLPEKEKSEEIVPFTKNNSGVCERMRTEVNEKLSTTTVVPPVVISFNVVSDDCVFEEKQNGFEESIMGASKQCGDATLLSHNIGTYGQNIENEKISAAKQLRDMIGGFTSYRDGVT
eukprot:g11776.t1